MLFLSIAPTIAAGLLIFILGNIWYRTRLFGHTWVRLTNLSPAIVEHRASRSFRISLLGLFAAMAIAATLRYLGTMGQVHSLSEGVWLALIVWGGIFLPLLVGPVLWEGKHLRLLAINGGYWLLALVAASVLLFA